MKKIHRLRSLILMLMVFMTGVSMQVHAGWTEGEVTILSLGEFLPLLSANMGLKTISDLPGSTPVLLPANLPTNDPKVVAVALVDSRLGLRQIDKGTLKVVSSTRSAREEADLRRKLIVPISPGLKSAGAIDQGGALLFGQIVEPPYMVETSGEEILINGVSVYPSPGLSEPVADQATENLAAGIDKACSAYDQDLLDLGSQKARTNLQQAMKNLTLIDDAQWLNENQLRLQMSDGSEEIFALQHEGRDPEPPTAADRAADLEDLARDLREALRQDYTICAGTTYLVSAPERGATLLRNRLREILVSGDTDNLKLMRLQARTGHMDAAADLLYAR